MKIGYSKKVMELFMNPKNVGVMNDANVTALTGSVACGDMIKLYLKIKDNIIKKITFESYGCAANIATSSMVTEMVKGKNIEYARKLSLKDEVEKLGGLPKIKYHCAVLAIKALRIALTKWDVIMGKKKIDENFVSMLLKGIMDPHTDKDIVSAGLIKKISIDGNKIFISVNIADDDYKEDILSNIKETFEKIDVIIEIGG